MIPPRALELEMQSIAGPPALGEAYELLRDQWRSGDRDRDLALHLMFLAWYVGLEPAHLTGFDEERAAATDLPAQFRGVHDHFAPSIQKDGEMLYVVGLMASICSWCIGDVEEWEARSLDYHDAYRRLWPNGISPKIFAGRGYYGHYFEGHARVVNGF